MGGQVLVNSWVGIFEGSEIAYRVPTGQDVHMFATDGDAPDFEFYFQREALRHFLEMGHKALAEMDELAARGQDD
jgi:hypothetical protein